MCTLEIEGSPLPCEALLKEVQPRLEAVLRRFSIPPEDAEDLLHKALLAYLYKRSEVRDPRSWLRRVLENQCRMYWRDRSRKIYRAVDEETLEWLAPADFPLRGKERALAVRDALARLRPRCRRFLLLTYWEGFDGEELARDLGYRKSSLGKIKSRCLDALGRELERLGWKPEILLGSKADPEPDR